MPGPEPRPSVLLVGPYPGDRFESIERFASCLERELGAELSVRLLSPRPIFGRFAIPGAQKWLGYLDKFLCFPRELRRASRTVDVIHLCDQSAAIYIPVIKQFPHLLTCNDLLAIRSALGEFPEHRTGFLGRRLQARILSGIREAAHVACISNATRRDVIRLSGLPEKRVHLVFMGAHSTFSPMAPTAAKARVRAFIPSGPFLLHVGGTQWYKNRRGLLEIYTKLSELDSACPNLALVGKPLEPELQALIRDRHLRVYSVPNCNDDDLRAFYSTARLLLFPSLHEGFGWPILEAQCCGCPVVTTNREPMSEVGGEAATYIDPSTVQAAAEALLAVLNESASERQQRIASGFRNASRFSTSRMITAYQALYAELSRRSTEVCSRQFSFA